MKLEHLGWNSFFEENFKKLEDNALLYARVVRREKLRYLVIAEKGELTVKLPGRFYRQGKVPVVGDWVAVVGDRGKATLTIKELLPRKNKLSRKVAGVTTKEQVIAANIDYVFLVMALDSDFSLRRLERYLTLIFNCGATPVIILNKTDVCPEVDKYLQEIKKTASGVAVLPVCALNNTGLDQLASYLKPGKTVSFIGSSGVGKSTLVNRLLGFDYMKTKALRKDMNKGSHTTSHRELILLPGGAVVIDSPGMRELQLWGSKDDLRRGFDDIEELATSCRFRDCQHTTEPSCAVKEAAETGGLIKERLANYRKMKEEFEALARKRAEQARRKGKRRGK